MRDNALQRRRLAYLLRGRAQYFATTASVQSCGHVGRADQVTIVRGAEGTADFRGISHCRNVWQCPVCCGWIQRERAGELRQLGVEVRASGGSLELLTLTMPHTFTDPLRPLRKLVARAWRIQCSGAPWKRALARWRIDGFVRALEVTAGISGWHPHLHVLLVLGEAFDESARRDVRAWMAERWCASVARALTERGTEPTIDLLPSLQFGCDLRPCGAVDYVQKMLGKVAQEVAAGGSTKRGRHRDRWSPFELLQRIRFRAAPNGEGRMVQPRSYRFAVLWEEYAIAMKGARQLTWSKGLRARAKLGEEVPDEQLPLPEIREPVEVCHFPRRQWAEVLALSPVIRARLLEEAARGSIDDASDRVFALLGSALAEHARRSRGEAPKPLAWVA